MIMIIIMPPILSYDLFKCMKLYKMYGGVCVCGCVCECKVVDFAITINDDTTTKKNCPFLQ